MIFGLLVKKFGRFTKTALCASRGDVRRKKSFNLKSFFSISFWIWADDFQDSGEKCRKHHQSCILPVQTNILPKKCFREKEFNTWGFSGKKSQNFGGKVSWRNFWGNKFCKKCNSNIYWFWERKFQTFLKSSQQSCQHGILRLRRMNSRKKMEVNSSLIFSDTAQTFLDFMRRVFRRIINYAFYAPKGSFSGIFCLESALRIHGFQTITCAGLLHKTFR